jgi:methyl-accepting chemotaxis protein
MMAQYREGRSRILALSRNNQTEQASALINSEFAKTAAQLMTAVEAHARFNYRRPCNWCGQRPHLQLVLPWHHPDGAGRAGHQRDGLAAVPQYQHGLSQIEHTIEAVSRQRDFRLRAKATARMKSAVPPAFNRMLESLQQAMRQLADGSRQVKTAAQELSQTAGEVSMAPVRKARHRPILPPPSSR